MFKVMLVDDERFIRKSIRNRIDWEKLGVYVEAEAENGVEALALLATVNPQIVLVDIRMPLMDGLSFITEARKRYPGIHYVIMSAYSDFEYAKKAIQLGVEDYILKPVKAVELEKLLDKIVHELNEEKLARRLQGMPVPDGPQLELKGAQIVALAFYIENKEGLEQLLESQLQSRLADNKAAVSVYYLRGYSYGDCYVFLLNGNSFEQDAVRECVEEIWLQLGNLEGVAAWTEVMESNKTGQAAKRCISVLKRKLFYPERKIITVRQLAVRSEAEKQALQVRQKKIRDELNFVYQQLLKKEYGKLKDSLEQLLKMIINRENTIFVIESSIAEIIVLLKQLLGGQEDNTESNIMFHRLQGKDYLLCFKTKEELEETLDEVIQNVLHTISEEDNQDVIVSIKQYIQNNFSDNLSAGDIAGRFFLNASYLSAIFKERTGMNMAAYIEAVRMEKAKQLLEDRNWNITEIASQTGYAESNYFSKVFKKYTGMSPKQYRESVNRR